VSYDPAVRIPAGWTARDCALVAVVPSLVVAIGIAHHVRVRTVDQSSWNGTGFGMFATFDSFQTRKVVAWTGDGTPLVVESTAAERWARIVPTDEHAEHAALDIARANHVAAGETLHVEVRSIDVHLDHEGVQVTVNRLVSVEVTVEADR
jgi:hypothetical protein